MKDKAFDGYQRTVSTTTNAFGDRMPLDGQVSVAEAARMLGVSRQYVYDLVVEDKIALHHDSVAELVDWHRKRLLDAARELREASDMYEEDLWREARASVALDGETQSLE